MNINVKDGLMEGAHRNVGGKKLGMSDNIGQCLGFAK